MTRGGSKQDGEQGKRGMQVEWVVVVNSELWAGEKKCALPERPSCSQQLGLNKDSVRGCMCTKSGLFGSWYRCSLQVM